MGPKIPLGRAHGNLGMCASVHMHRSVNTFRSVNRSVDVCSCVYRCSHALCMLHTVCTGIFILYVHGVCEYVCVCHFVNMSVCECVSGHSGNCVGCVCTCVSAAEYSFSSIALVTVTALCGKEGFWWPNHAISFRAMRFLEHKKSALGPSLGELMPCGPPAATEGSISSLLPVPLAEEVDFLAVNWDPDTHSRSWLTPSSLAFFPKRLSFRGEGVCTQRRDGAQCRGSTVLTRLQEDMLNPGSRPLGGLRGPDGSAGVGDGSEHSLRCLQDLDILPAFSLTSSVGQGKISALLCLDVLSYEMGVLVFTSWFPSGTK